MHSGHADSMTGENVAENLLHMENMFEKTIYICFDRIRFDSKDKEKLDRINKFIQEQLGTQVDIS